MSSRVRSFALATFALTALTASASAQVAGQFHQSDESLLESRGREILHTGENPLDLQGLDQGPDGFRSGTPALQRGDVGVALVDAEMLRNRRLALYDTKARYDAPVAALATAPAEESEEAAPRSAPDEPEPQDEGGSGKYAIIGAIAVACGLAAHFFLRKR